MARIPAPYIPAPSTMLFAASSISRSAIRIPALELMPFGNESLSGRWVA